MSGRVGFVAMPTEPYQSRVLSTTAQQFSRFRKSFISAMIVVASGCADMRPAESSAPVLRVLTTKLTHSDYLHTALGEIENVSKAPLENLIIVITFRDASGSLLTTDTSVVTPNPLAPGERTTFKATLWKDKPAASFTVAFRKVGGATVPHVER